MARVVVNGPNNNVYGVVQELSTGLHITLNQGVFAPRYSCTTPIGQFYGPVARTLGTQNRIYSWSPTSCKIRPFSKSLSGELCVLTLLCSVRTLFNSILQKINQLTACDDQWYSDKACDSSYNWPSSVSNSATQERTHHHTQQVSWNLKIFLLIHCAGFYGPAQ